MANLGINNRRLTPAMLRRLQVTGSAEPTTTAAAPTTKGAAQGTFINQSVATPTPSTNADIQTPVTTSKAPDNKVPDKKALGKGVPTGSADDIRMTITFTVPDIDMTVSQTPIDIDSLRITSSPSPEEIQKQKEERAKNLRDQCRSMIRTAMNNRQKIVDGLLSEATRSNNPYYAYEGTVTISTPMLQIPCNAEVTSDYDQKTGHVTYNAYVQPANGERYLINVVRNFYSEKYPDVDFSNL